MKVKEYQRNLLPALLFTGLAAVMTLLSWAQSPSPAWGIVMTQTECRRCHGTDDVMITAFHHSIRDANNWTCTQCHKPGTDPSGGYTLVVERDCTVCHGPGYHTEPAGTNPKRHHAMRNAYDYGCLHCHPVVQDPDGNFSVVLSRDCFFCHKDGQRQWREVKWLTGLETTTSPDTAATATDVTSKFHDTLMYESFEIVNTATTDKALSVKLLKDAANTSKVTLSFYVFEPAVPQATIRVYPYLLDGVTVNTAAYKDFRISTTGWNALDVTSIAKTMAGFTWMKFRVTVLSSPLYLSEGSFEIIRKTTDTSGNLLPIPNAGPDRVVYTSETVTFSGAGSTDPDGTIASYFWNFGDGTTGTGIESSHVYTAPGVYLVSLLVKDNLGAVDEDFAFVSVKGTSLPPNQPPVANAGPDLKVTAGQPFTLSAVGSTDPDGQIASYTWSFEDGTSAAGETVTKIFGIPGIYNVTLTITDNRGAIVSDKVVITVLDPGYGLIPTANAGPDTYASVGTAVTFSGAASTDDGQIVSYQWDFGDGTTGTGVSATKTYTAPGVYVVTLTVTDNYGSKSADTLLISIHDIIKQNQPPLADAAPTVTTSVGEAVIFSGAASKDIDGTIVSYNWNFGDGTTATGVTATKAFTSPGIFTVTLTVTDNGNASGTATAVVTVTATPNVAPVANAGPDVSAEIGQPLVLSGAGSSDADGTIASYRWDFGDGTTGTGISPAKTYLAEGTYIVTLFVTDNTGATSSDTAMVVIYNNPPVANAGPDVYGAVGETVTFSCLGSSDKEGPIASCSWDFGDGTTAIGFTVTKTYTAAGLFTVLLEVADQDGAVAADTAVATILPPVGVNLPPVANAGPDVAATTGQSLSFSGSGSSDPDGTIASYRWAFGDGTSQTGLSVTKSYATAGTYTVTLTVTDNLGAISTDTAIVTVTQANIAPIANAGPDVAGAPGKPVSFACTGSTDRDGTIVSYLWAFGDGSTASGCNVTKTYNSAGKFTVTLTVTDNLGAKGTDTAIANILRSRK